MFLLRKNNIITIKTNKMRPLFLKLCLIIFALSSCLVHKKFLDEINRASIPNDLKNSKYVLLIETPSMYPSKSLQRTYTKQITKYMKDYPGQWEWASPEEINSSKFSNTSKYRYFLKHNSVIAYAFSRSSSLEYTPNAGPMGISMEYHDQIFVDRKENKEYPSTNNARSNYSWGIAVLVAYLKEN